jgi:hypothetical protein
VASQQRLRCSQLKAKLGVARMADLIRLAVSFGSAEVMCRLPQRVSFKFKNKMQFRVNAGHPLGTAARRLYTEQQNDSRAGPKVDPDR